MVPRLRTFRSLASCFFYVCLVVLFLLYFFTPYFHELLEVDTTFVHPSNTKGKNVNNFANNWLRLTKARVDWQAIFSPCTGNIQWGSSTPGWEKNMRTSAKESYVEYTDIRRSGEFSKIFLRTRTENGNEKRFGGDSWRVLLKGPSSIIATVFDHANGSYEAIALLIEPGEYVVEAILDYSLCDGLKDPPENWFRAGNAQGRYQPKGLLLDGAKNDYILKRLQQGKNITIQILPAKFTTESMVNGFSKMDCATCSALWNGYGRWVKNNWRPYSIAENSNVQATQKTTMPFTKRHETLWIFGDSLASHFHVSLSKKLLCKRIFRSCRRSHHWVYAIPGASDKYRNDNLDFRPDIVLESVRDVLRRGEMQSNESLLVLNLGLHFSISLNFTTYQHLITDVIKMLKSREKELGSRAKVIWKTTTAIHKEKQTSARVDLRFFTSQRVQLFDVFAMSAMCKAGIDVLDVYHLSASYPGGTTNVVHYNTEVFYAAEMEIERYVKDGLGKNLKRVCIG